MKKLLFLLLLLLNFSYLFSETETKDNLVQEKSYWGFTSNNSKEILQLGIVQSNYLNLSSFNKNLVKYSNFIGLVLVYDEWLEIDFNLINLITAPIIKEDYISNMYLSLSFAFYIFKYQNNINENLILKVLFGTEINITIRTGVFVGKIVHGFLHPYFPMLSIKFETEFIKNKYSFFVKFSTMFQEFQIIDFGIIFII